MSHNSIPWKTAVLFFLIWLVGSWAVCFFGIPEFWGMLPAGKLAGGALLVWMLLCVAVLFGLDGGLAERAVQRTAGFIPHSGGYRRYSALAIVSGGLFLLAWGFRSGNHYMGDGWMYLNVVAEPFRLMPDRPLDYLVHHLTFRLLVSLGRAEPELSYAVLHCALFPFFCLALWSLAGSISEEPARRAALTLILAGNSALLLFCGYVESYTILAFFSTLYLAAGADYVCRGGYKTGLPWTASLLYLLAFLSHRSAVVLGPSLLFLWLVRLWRSEKQEQPLKQFYTVLALAPLPLVIGILLRFASLDLLVPLVNSSEIAPYTIFSGTHLREKLNFLLLIAPATVISIPTLVTGWSTVRSKVNPLFLFLSLTLLGSVFFLFVLNPMLGMRDWDLLSLCAVPASAWSGWILFQCLGGSKHGGSPLLAIGLGLVFHGMLWVWINSDIYRGVAFLQRIRYEDPHTFSGKTNFAKELLDRGFILESIEQNRLAGGKMYLRGLVNNAEIFMRLGRPDSTIYYTRKAIDYEITHNLRPTPTVWIKGAAAFEVLEWPDSANHYYLKPLRGDRDYYDVEDRRWWITQVNSIFDKTMNKATLDQMNLDYTLFFLRYNSMVGRDEYISKIYNFYMEADFNKEQWEKLLDFAIVSRHTAYVDTLKSYAYRRYPELREVFESKR